jgi:hypothetical protein
MPHDGAVVHVEDDEDHLSVDPLDIDARVSLDWFEAIGMKMGHA